MAVETFGRIPAEEAVRLPPRQCTGAAGSGHFGVACSSMFDWAGKWGEWTNGAVSLWFRSTFCLTTPTNCLIV